MRVEFNKANIYWIALTILGFGIFFIAMPIYRDDWWFIYWLKPWFDAQPSFSEMEGGNIFKFGFPWKEFWETYREHYLEDNLRISNVVATFFLLIPKWIGSSVILLCWVYTIRATFKTAGINWRNSALIPVAIFLWVFTFKWSDKMGCLDFQYNYIAGSAIFMWLYLYQKRHRNSTAISSRIALFFLALLLGTWHEGFAVPYACGIGMILLFCKTNRHERINILIAETALCLGLIFLMLSPHFYGRAAYDMAFGMTLLRRVPTVILSWHFSDILFFALSIYYIIRRGWRHFADHKYYLFSIGVIIVALGLAITMDFRRVGWVGDLVAVPALLMILNDSWPHFWQKYTMRNALVACILLLPAFCTLALGDFYAIKYGGIYRRISYEYATTGRTLFFEDVAADDSKPYLSSLFINNEFIFDVMEAQTRYYTRQRTGMIDSPIRIIPAEVEDFSPAEAQKIPGTFGALQVGGSIVAPYYDEMGAGDYLDIRFGPIHRPRQTVMYRIFTNRRDGHRYALLLLSQGKMLRPLFGITEINHQN